MDPSAGRYYERRGPLPRAARNESGYRMLGEETVERLRFIRQAQTLGLQLDEIREILSLRDHGKTPCRRVSEMAAKRLRAIDDKLAELRHFRRSLSRLLDYAQERRRATGHTCPLIESAPHRRGRRRGRDIGRGREPALSGARSSRGFR